MHICILIIDILLILKNLKTSDHENNLNVISYTRNLSLQRLLFNMNLLVGLVYYSENFSYRIRSCRSCVSDIMMTGTSHKCCGEVDIVIYFRNLDIFEFS